MQELLVANVAYMARRGRINRLQPIISRTVHTTAHDDSTLVWYDLIGVERIHVGHINDREEASIKKTNWALFCRRWKRNRYTI